MVALDLGWAPRLHALASTFEQHGVRAPIAARAQEPFDHALAAALDGVDPAAVERAAQWNGNGPAALLLA